MKKILILLQFSLLTNLSAQVSDWSLLRSKGQVTRGGNSQGIPVKINKEENKRWKELKNENLSSFEKDRKAILALQGEFKATFEFLETQLIETKLKADVPYASWGTEFVELVEDKGDFISLQHILVMSFKNKETGKVDGPFVVKHWRQDWTWEADEKLEFQGENHWKVKKLKAKEFRGKWKWTVFQVDDTPRYSALGSWTHLKSASTFDTELFSRPLPRREFSVRSDYKLLLGKDSLVLTSNSWYHEQRNFKHVNKLGNDNSMNEGILLSREVGQNSYLRLKGYDFSKGKEYWENSKTYWKDVRSVWRKILRFNKDFKLKKEVNGKKLFSYHFKNAGDSEILKMPSKNRKKLIMKLIKSFIQQ